MNAGLANDHPSIYYYDGDYPGAETTPFPENFDETTRYQGLAYDVERYKEIAGELNGPVLELCCGTGRVAIPLARAGHQVTGVDLSPGILSQFKAKLSREPNEMQSRVTLVEQDVTELALEQRDFAIAIVPFNSLLCITDFAAQEAALRGIHAHLAKGGMVVLDIVNPLQLKLQGDPTPKAFFTRRNPHTGNLYTRFAMIDAFDSEHRQRLHGWYDEIETDGHIKRQHYSMLWRPLFRFEAELLLRITGFRVTSLEGGHQKEPFAAQSPRMFFRAVKES